MLKLTRNRFLTGFVIGIFVALLLVAIVSADAATTLESLGGMWRLLIVGGVVGVTYAGLFRPQISTPANDLMNGVITSIVAWIVLALNLFPLFEINTPMWDVSTASDVAPKLIAYALLGGGIGLLYGIVARRLKLSADTIGIDDSTKKTRVLIVGGGYAGVSAAEQLDQAFLRDPTVEITLISKTNYLLHTPMLSEVSSSAVSPQNISPPLRSFFQDVRVVVGDVATVDWAKQTVELVPNARSPQRTLSFDHLAITAGGVPNFFGNKGVENHCYTFKSLHDSMVLRNQIIDMFERADFEQYAARKQCMLTFVVIGGGFAGVELIGGLNDFGRGMLPNYRNISPDEVRFVLIHTRDVILPELSEALGRFAQEKMAARGVEFILNKRVTGAEKGAVLLGDVRVEAETVVWTAGNRPHPIVDKLGVTLTRRGQISVAATLQSQEQPLLWAAGDCAQIPDPNNEGEFYPPTAQHALREGKKLGANISGVIRGQAPKPFNFKTLGSLAALGHQLAVAELFGYRFSGFLAWLMWRGIYLSKLPSLEKRTRVLLDWLLDILFPPDIVQTIHFDEPDDGQAAA
ncbi:MAG: NAD(P)/FAD-dependent oxidoreductase [Chloroflexota bacterium]